MAALAHTPSPAPIVFFLPARDEAPTVAEVVRRMPATVAGHPVVPVVVDDGSRDTTAAEAELAGARVVSGGGRGLGSAVRIGLAEAVAGGAAAVAFCDADGEYDPAQLDTLVAPILRGEADYVVGSRFAGGRRHMRAHRSIGNRLLTLLVRRSTRLDVTDGQSGFRVLSARAAADAEIVHDYNYAQVLTLELVAKGYRYAEVPITYTHRTTGRSFVRLGTYLRHVLPHLWHMRIRRDRSSRQRLLAA